MSYRRIRDAWWVVAVLLAYLSVWFVARLVLPSPGTAVVSVSELVAVLPIPLALVFGRRVLWVLPMGYALTDLLGGAVGTGTIFIALAHVYLGYAAVRLSGRYDGFPLRSADSVRSTLRPFLMTVGVATAGATAIVAWGWEITHVTPFFVTVVFVLPVALALNAVVALPLTVGLRAALGVEPGDAESFGRRRAASVGLLTAGWVVAGTVLSLGYRSFERVPRTVFVDRDVAFLLLFDRPDLFGPGAGRLQALLGAIALSSLVLTLAKFGDA